MYNIMYIGIYAANVDEYYDNIDTIVCIHKWFCGANWWLSGMYYP